MERLREDTKSLRNVKDSESMNEAISLINVIDNSKIQARTNAYEQHFNECYWEIQDEIKCHKALVERTVKNLFNRELRNILSSLDQNQS